jgi:hypothetical protein
MVQTQTYDHRVSYKNKYDGSAVLITCAFSTLKFILQIYFIQSVSGGIVNILGDGSMDYSK